MSLSNKAFAYPPEIRKLFYALAQHDGKLEYPIPYASEKAAIADRAKFYRLRKILSQNAEEQGNITLAEKFYTIGLRLEKTRTGATLTIFNQYTPVSSEFLTAARDILQELPDSNAAPTVAPNDLKEFEEKLRREAADANGSVLDNMYGFNSGEDK